MWPRVLGNPFRSLGNRGGGGNSYLLQDTFTTARSAGAVNGTPAEPTGQARTVVDTNSKLSIAVSKLAFATGGSVEGNPGVWYTAFTRVAGLVAIADILVDGSSVSGVTAGWFTAQNNSGGNTIRPVLGSLLGVRANGTAITVAADLGFGVVTYRFAVVLRSTGSYHFIKGGVYTFWTLLWVNPNGNTTPMYLGICAVATTTVGNADNADIPTNLYIPPQIAYDTFARSNGALGSTETTGSDGQVLTALAWTSAIGTWAITSNKAGASALSGGLAIATIPVTTKDNFIEAALTRAGGSVGVVGRYTDASNYIYAYHDGTNAGVKQRLAAVETDLIAATAATFVADAVIRLVMDGNSCLLFYNNVRIGGTGTINAGLSGAVDGLYTTNTGNTFDLVTSWARGNSGEYSGLDAF